MADHVVNPTDEFVSQHPKGHFMQTSMWAKVKTDWSSRVVEVDGKGCMLLLIRKVPFFPYKIMYSPRGPVCDVHDRETLAELTKKCREVAKQVNAYTLKIDPDVESSDTEFADIMGGLGFKVKKTQNFEGIQPNYVFRLDVENRTEQEIMAGFHQKTRYNIRVAIKNGVEVSIGTRDDLPRFQEIMRETGTRDDFVIRPLSYFQRMYDVLGDNMRLYIAKYQGKIIAATIAVQFGDKVWYLYGASSNESRNVMPNYLLQWEMIKWSIETKCRIYDFRGVSGDLNEKNPLYGLYKFKKGFNGKFTEFVGEMELQFRPFVAWGLEKGMHAFVKVRGVLLRRATR